MYMKQVAFNTLSIQNFLSVGNEPVCVDFTKGFHIITGKNKDKPDRRNGVGKSTIADAINFAIFGSTLRELKKELIVNNITNGDCIVSLELTVKTPSTSNDYKIIRTLSPTKCYIYKNGKDITRDTINNTTSYINDLINCTEDVFQNCVVMTVNNATPFMAKKKNEKRKFIEGIFNLQVFSDMSNLLRADCNTTKQNFDIESTKYEEIKTSLEHYKIQQKNIEQDKQQKIIKIKERNKEYNQQLSKLTESLQEIDNSIIEQNNKTIHQFQEKNTKLVDKKVNVNINITKLQSKNNELSKTQGKMGTDEFKCPVCLQKVNEFNREHIKKEKDTIQNIINTNLKEIDSLQKTITLINNGITKIQSTIQTLQKNNTDINNEINKQKLIYEQIKQITNYKSNLKLDLKDLKNNNTSLTKTISEYEDRLNSTKDNITTMSNKNNMLDVVKYIISEEGVKSYIVKKMLNVFNSKLSYYLKKMESNCICIFNEYFEEQIVNEKGKLCSYFNFSSAERKNIDLACLFAFMDIRRLQGDVAFNLSIYDELFDSSLDQKGVELVVNILKDRIEKYNECVMIISHRKESVKAAQGEIIYLQKENGITKRLKYIDM